VRVIAATHRDLQREVARGRFREDLFFRLHVFPIRIPPLRERPEDVLALAQHFLALHGAGEGSAGARSRRRAAPAAAHRWPGNARELENAIVRALVLARAARCSGGALRPARGRAAAARDRGPRRRGDEPLRDTLARVEAWLIRSALDRNAGAAARPRGAWA
jgi:DNA-binding NtrC family response regulator